MAVEGLFGSRVAGFLRRANGARLARRARRALDSDDYDSAARFIQTFLQIDARFRDSGSDQREQLLDCKRRLESIVRSRLAAAVDERDHPTILRFVRVFPPLGLEEEGLQIFVAYLRTVIALRSWSELERLKEIAERGGVDFVTCLANLFNDIDLAVETNLEVLRSLCGKDGIVYAIYDLLKEWDCWGTQVLNEYMDYRNLSQLASEIDSYSRNLTEGPDPIMVGMYMEEILSLTQLGERYTELMVSKIRAVYPEFAPRATEAFRSGSFNRAVQDLITGFYAILEEFFMVKNVRTAITIDEHVPDSLTSSMVGDVFYVLKICCMRSISTGSSNLVLALLSRAIDLLTNEYTRALQLKIRTLERLVYLKISDDPTTYPSSYMNISADLALYILEEFEEEWAEMITTNISAINNVEISADYVLILRQKIEEQCAEVFPSPADREKVKSCLSELGEINSTYKRLLSSEMKHLMASISHRIRPVLDSVATVSYELSRAEYFDNLFNDPWVHKLLHAIETDIAFLQPVMTGNIYNLFVHLLIQNIVDILEKIVMQKRFSQLGGQQLDREVRALVNHFSEMSQRPVGDKFARLSQMITILNFERVSEILDFWGENARPMTWLLTPACVRRVLGLRIDFEPEAIAALRL